MVVVVIPSFLFKGSCISSMFEGSVQIRNKNIGVLRWHTGEPMASVIALHDYKVMQLKVTAAQATQRILEAAPI